MILEGRAAMGGTWDLFRYPGVRSDSDMYTLGYRFRPWRDAKAIADGPAILDYIRETAAEFGVDSKIRYDHRVRRASWSSDDARWTVEAEAGPEKTPVLFTCNFLYLCTGYYDYESGYTPEWPGVESLPRADRAPAEVARRPRLCGQARRRHRQRGDGRHARPRDGRARRRTSRCYSARRPTSSRGPPRTRSPTGSADFCPTAPPTRSRAGRTCCWGCSSTAWRGSGPNSSSGWWRRACVTISARNTTSDTSRRGTTRGTSACASSRIPTSFARYVRAGPRSSPTRSRPSRRPVCV